MGWKRNITIFMLNNSIFISKKYIVQIIYNLYYNFITKKYMYSFIRYLSRKLTKA